MNSLDTSFINAQQRHKENPDTFEVPSNAELEALAPKDFIKIGVRIFDPNSPIEAERFWLQITQIRNRVIYAKVDNDLVFTDYHSIADGDELMLAPHHVLAILRGDHECAN